MSDVPKPKTVEQVDSVDESGSPLAEDAQQEIAQHGDVRPADGDGRMNGRTGSPTRQ